MFRSILVAGALVAAPASAATVTIERIADLQSVNLNFNFGFEEELASPVYLSAGDTLDLTLRFTGSQTLRINDPFDIRARVIVPVEFIEDNFTSDASFSFRGAKGSTPAAPIADFEYNGNGHFGNIIDPEQIGAGSIEFSGLRLVAKVVSFDTPGPHSFRFSSFFFRGLGYSIGTAVPEPGTWAMMIAGFGMVGAAVRRQPRRLLAA
jgi:hypothetical protein